MTFIAIKHSPGKIALSIFLFALIIRLFYVLFYPQLPLESEANGYDILGWRLAKGKGFIGWEEGGCEIAKTPAYQLFIAAIYRVFGHNPEAVRIAQAFISALLAAMVYFFAIKLLKNNKLGITAGIIVGLLPSFIAYTGLLFTETLFTFFYLFSFLVLYLAIEQESNLYYIFTGILLGLGALVSPRTQYITIFILFGFLFLFNKKKKAIMNFLLISLFFILTILPWTVRNYAISGKFIFLADYYRGNSYWLAFNKDGLTELDYTKEPLKSIAQRLTDRSKWNELLHEAAMNDLKKYPLSYPKNCLKRFLKLWFASHSNNFYGFRETLADAFKKRHSFIFIFKLMLLLVNSIIVLLGFWGMCIKRRYWKELLVLYIPISYLTAIHTLFVTSPRLQIPMMPFLIIFSSYAIIDIKDKFSNHRYKT